MANKIQIRRDTLANWEAVNPVLGDGEPGFVIDTNQVKYGDGSTPWNNLGWGGTGLNPASVAIGEGAGKTNQGGDSVAIGLAAGYTTQGDSSVAIGGNAGSTTQGYSAVAVGSAAGRDNQGYYAIAIGEAAGVTNQGPWSIAIGSYAGQEYQTTGSIAILAGDNAGNINVTNVGLYIDPIRNDLTSTNLALFYDATTKEITYNTAPQPNALSNGTHSVTLTSDGALTGDGANGNFYIDTVTSTGTTSTWVFDVSGTTTLPGAVVKSTVSATGTTATTTALDLTKSIQKLSEGHYSLADGVEGQIMYLVSQPGVTTVANVSVEMLNVYTAGSPNTYPAWLYPFQEWNGVSMVPSYYAVTLIFTDGAWQTSGGNID